jgi:hypothetical protein
VSALSASLKLERAIQQGGPQARRCRTANSYIRNVCFRPIADIASPAIFAAGGFIVRFVLAIAGILVSVPPLIFFWIGTQTFARHSEKLLAFVMMVGTGALLALSIVLFFVPSVQRLQAVLLIATIVTSALILMADRLFR